MTSDTRSSAEIEREIEHQRSELTENLEALQQKFSLDGMIREATSQIREHGSEIGQSVSQTLRENPVPATLIAVGLGWLMFGKRAPAHQAALREDYSPDAVQQTPPARGSDTVQTRRPAHRPQRSDRDLPSWAQDESWDEADH